MPQVSNLSFDVRFSAHNPNVLSLTDTTLSLPTGYVGVFKVTQPDGYVRSGDINNPDVTTIVRSCVVSILPDSSGKIQQGQYSIELTASAPGYFSTTFIRTFTLSYTPAVLDLRNDFDLFTPSLAYTDISNYSVSGYNVTGGPTREWTSTSPTTGTIISSNSSVDIKYNNKYYSENYNILFEVSMLYVHQTYPWLTVGHNQSKTVLITACIPKSIEELTQAIEALRVESSAACGGDWQKFEKANSLYAHLLNMLRLVLFEGGQQDGFFDVYQQLLSYLYNGQTSCSSIGQEIPPYDFSDYEHSFFDGQASFCTLVGNGVDTVFRVEHDLGANCIVVQVFEVATGKLVFCDIAISTIDSIDITFFEPPTQSQYRVVVVTGATGLKGETGDQGATGPGVPIGGTVGQYLQKNSLADYDTRWANSIVNSIKKRFIVGDAGYPAAGATTWTDPNFSGSTLWLYRNKILQDWVDPGDGDSYYTLTGSTITFYPALGASEKINLLIF
jgi:hypothetical protein